MRKKHFKIVRSQMKSTIVRLEFLSSIYRRYREGELTENEIDLVVDAFDEQLLSVYVEPIEPPIIQQSELLMRNYGKNKGLRSLDAIHLATCRLIARHDWVFVCADSKLCDVACECGLSVNNPNRKSKDPV
ncbi:MAG: type II toxin-antitoxin system VapC family toxin [Deltaproteobacteria bacterium]|nr:type II toxin-antitoxin system VapC family toxin [Deltaproteobacteria bacterium]